MTKFLQPSFSINNAGNKAYASGWDAVFGRKECGRERVRTGEPTSKCVLEPGHGFPPGHIYGREWETSDIREHVEEFHRVYEIPVAETPGVPEQTLLDKQLRCIGEEFIELLEACGADRHGTQWLTEALAEALEFRDRSKVDLVEATDACGDLDYTVESLRLVCGVNGKPIADEIQRSNLSKLGADGGPLKRGDGKILKGPNFTAPDIAGELRKQGWEG